MNYSYKTLLRIANESSWRHDGDSHNEFRTVPDTVRGRGIGARPERPCLRPATGCTPQDSEGRRAGHLLPRGWSEGRPHGPPAPRLPDQLADVPQPDPGTGGQVSPGRAGLSRLR